VGIVGFPQIPAMVAVINGDASPFLMTNHPWFLWFSFLVPRKRSQSGR
jgi:hypothetical protein